VTPALQRAHPAALWWMACAASWMHAARTAAHPCHQLSTRELKCSHVLPRQQHVPAGTIPSSHMQPPMMVQVPPAAVAVSQQQAPTRKARVMKPQGSPVMVPTAGNRSSSSASKGPHTVPIASAVPTGQPPRWRSCRRCCRTAWRRSSWLEGAKAPPAMAAQRVQSTAAAAALVPVQSRRMASITGAACHTSEAGVRMHSPLLGYDSTWKRRAGAGGGLCGTGCGWLTL
jgi:hypothetical protein